MSRSPYLIGNIPGTKSYDQSFPELIYHMPIFQYFYYTVFTRYPIGHCQSVAAESPFEIDGYLDLAR
jgi:hypothetical protein